jgi:hypothetical protein
MNGKCYNPRPQQAGAYVLKSLKFEQKYNFLQNVRKTRVEQVCTGLVTGWKYLLVE